MSIAFRLPGLARAFVSKVGKAEDRFCRLLFKATDSGLSVIDSPDVTYESDHYLQISRANTHQLRNSYDKHELASLASLSHRASTSNGSFLSERYSTRRHIPR